MTIIEPFGLTWKSADLDMGCVYIALIIKKFYIYIK